MRALVLFVSLLVASPAVAQVVTEMTPELIRRAIDDRGAAQCRTLMKGGKIVACYTTPYSRVATAADDARKLYKTFTEADVTRDILAPELWIIATGGWNGRQYADVQTVAILPANETDPAKAVRPISIQLIDQNDGDGALARFPLSALSDDNVVHVVYDVSYCGDTDCAVRFDAGGVR